MEHVRKVFSSGFAAALGVSLVIGAAPARVDAAPAYRDTIVSQNPLAYWRFNDGTLAAGGSIAAEVGGGVSAAKNAGGVTEAVAGPGFAGLGEDNTAFSYDNSTNAITYDLTGASGSATGLTSNAGSVSYWFRRPVDNPDDPNDNRTAVLFFGTDKTATNSTADGFTDNTLHTWITAGGRTGFYLDGREVGVLSEPYDYLYSDGNWHHAVATWDRTTGIIAYYLDGGDGGGLTSSHTYVADFSGDLWDSFSLTTDRFGKARFSTSRFFLGDGDELAVWTRALSEAEVLAQFTAAAVPEPASLGLLGVAAAGLMLRRRH